MHERGDAARAVAALLHLAAVGVEDAVEHGVSGAARRLEHQRLVETDAGMAVGKRRHCSAVGSEAPAGASNTMKSLPTPCIFVKSSAWATG